MKNRFTFLVSLLLIALTSSGWAQQVLLPNSLKNEFKIVNQSTSSLEVKANVHSFNNLEVATSVGSFNELSIPGFTFSNDAGLPKVPVIRKVIEVPLGAHVTLTFKNGSYKEYSLAQLGINHPLFPCQPSVSKQADLNSLPFVYNQEAYQKDAWLYDDRAKVEVVGQMRALRLARLDIYPVQYNPVQGKIRVYETVNVVVNFNGAQTAKTQELKKKTYSPYFEQAYKLTANYQPLPSDELITDAPATYVIVSDPMFQATLQPFIAWKTKKGFKVIEAYTNNPEVGNTTTSIKTYLQGLYNTPPAGYYPPSFVLLVGDVAQIPAYNGTAGSHITDLYYFEYTGDKIPEVYYGRFSATSIAHLQPQIDKTLEYEQYLFPDPSFLNEVTMVAGDDAGYVTHSNGQINYGTSTYFNAAHGLLSHTYLQPEPAGANYSQSIHNDVSEGVAYANYTAHGSPSGWADPSFLISDIPALQNQSKYPLMVGNCCQTSMFGGSCFAEELLRAQNKGALGYIGGTNSSYWDEDYWWGCGFKSVTLNPVYDPAHLGAYDVTFHDHGEDASEWFVTQGQMVVGGNMAVEESSSSMKTYYWEIYCLMGDPSISIYFSEPDPVVANYQNTLLVGMNSLTVNTEQYAYVALSFNGNLLATGIAGPTGVVNLSFTALSNVGTANLVITKQNRKPHLGEITVAPATGPYLIVQSIAVNDSLGNNNGLADYNEDVFLDVTFKNVGVQPANNVTAELTTPDAYLEKTDSVCTINTAAAGAVFTVQNAFRMLVNSSVPDQHIADLAFNMGDGTNVWASTAALTLNAPVFSFSELIVDDAAGNGNGILDPGETANLVLNTTNSGHADAYNTVCTLSAMGSSTAYIIVNNPTITINTVAPGTTQQALFSVVTNIITPPQTTVDMRCRVTAGMQSQYSYQEMQELVIGGTASINISNGNMNTCNARFYDSGGEAANYGVNEDYVMTFYPGITGAKVKYSFNSFAVEQNSSCTWDYLTIYNGTSTSAPQIGNYCGTGIPPAYTANNADGAITFKFHSDGVVTKSGWDASISCVGGNLTVTASAFPPSVCEGSTSQLGTLTVGGSGNYNYVWHPGKYLDDSTSATPIATPDVTTTFTVEVSDGVTTLNANATVSVNPVPVTPVISLQDNTLISDATEGNQWYNQFGPVAGATSQMFTPEMSGQYYVKVSNTFGCQSDASNSIYVVITGIKTEEATEFLQVSPNPFKHDLNIACGLKNETNASISVYNSMGQEIAVLADNAKLSSGNHNFVLPSSGLVPGIYYVKFTTGKSSIVKRVMFIK